MASLQVAKMSMNICRHQLLGAATYQRRYSVDTTPSLIISYLHILQVTSGTILSDVRHWAVLPNLSVATV